MATNTTSTSPGTLLEAVNTLLRAIGATEVMSLNTADMDQRAQGALQVLSEQARVVQLKGWHFNTEEDYPLSPATDGRIALPINTAAFKVSARSRSMDVAQRGLYLYDRRQHTFVFTDPIYADLTLLFEFAEVPSAIRWYITAKAGVIFGVGRKPDTGTYRFTSEVEDEALGAALVADTEARFGLDLDGFMK